MNNRESAAAVMFHIGPLTIGNTVVTPGVMLIFLLSCSLPPTYQTLTGSSWQGTDHLPDHPLFTAQWAPSSHRNVPGKAAPVPSSEKEPL